MKKFILSGTTVTHKNGGLEMGLLQAVNEDGGLSETDKSRLKHLETLPPNRTEEFENRFAEMEDDARQIEEAAELDLMRNEDY